MVDTTPPVVTVPADLVVEATSGAGATVGYKAVAAVDIVDLAITPTCSPASGTQFPETTTVVTCSATDRAGNVGSASFKVTVHDTTPPVMVVTPDRLANANGWYRAAVT